MARETKVGLVAGLAFIVCFAVILTNKGDRRVVRPGEIATAAPPQHVEPRPRPGPTAGRRPVRDGRRHPAQMNRRFHGTGVTNRPEWRRPMPKRQWDESPRGPGDRMTPDAGPFRTGAPPEHGRVRPAPTSLSTYSRDADADAHAMRDPADPEPRRPQSTQHREPQRERPTGSDDPTAGRARSSDAATSPRQSRRAVLARYTVAPGDTLTRIARRHYGAGSKQFVNAIVDANRSIIADPDVLHAGLDLTIPALPGHTARRSATSSGPRATAASLDRTPVTTFRWYQIKPNDRYITIAREQLGDAGRWREIYELNKGKFPDPGRIRPGVRIKLPPAGSALAGGRR